MKSPMDCKTVHNFRTEDKTIFILGGYIIVKKPRTHYVCNILFLLSMILLYLFFMLMAVVTIVIFSDKSEIVEKTSYIILILTTGGFVTPLIGMSTESSSNSAVELLLKGIDQYIDEDFNREYDKIKENRVNQVNFLCAIVRKLLFFPPILAVLVVPLIKVFILTEEEKNTEPLNPLLPFPLYIPFNTRTYFGFGVVFIASGVFHTYANVSGICIVTTYLSCTLQLVAQIEVLNHSLKNIEARAYSKLKKSGTTIRKDDKERLYQLMEYQEWLYFCLRENILHHQNILRFIKALQPFLGRIYALGFISISILMAVAMVILLEQPNIDPAIVSVLFIATLAFYVISLGSQFIKDKSAETVQSLYSTPWTHCNSSYKVLLKIMLPKTQELIMLRAAGINTHASLELFAEMMSGVYKIMNVLRP